MSLLLGVPARGEGWWSDGHRGITMRTDGASLERSPARPGPTRVPPTRLKWSGSISRREDAAGGEDDDDDP